MQRRTHLTAAGTADAAFRHSLEASAISPAVGTYRRGVGSDANSGRTVRHSLGGAYSRGRGFGATWAKLPVCPRQVQSVRHIPRLNPR
jgi:hypothetical protein